MNIEPRPNSLYYGDCLDIMRQFPSESVDLIETQIVGMVTEYHPNRATGEALPGLLIAQDVSHLREVARRIKSIEEALALISSLNASP